MKEDIKLEEIAVDLSAIYVDGRWGHYQLIVQVKSKKYYDVFRIMTGPEFRKLFGGENVLSTAKLILNYKGDWLNKRSMKINFVTIEDAKLFVDDIITPYILMNNIK